MTSNLQRFVLGVFYTFFMPTYDYLCEECGHRFEFFQSMNDEKLRDCPKDDCDGPVKRLLGTGAGIIFKGGGFYETDYRSESYKSGAKKESEASKPKESKSSDASGSGSKGDSGAGSGGSSSKSD
jgi:putative FmdB family regulatory protein|tara:strand:- start:208 stop:582 length:375 start_codon:yes stop_codon:yes gene_type:complete